MGVGNYQLAIQEQYNETYDGADRRSQSASVVTRALPISTVSTASH